MPPCICICAEDFKKFQQQENETKKQNKKKYQKKKKEKELTDVAQNYGKPLCLSNQH